MAKHCGVEDKASKTIIAEIGVVISVFPTSQHLSSWAGLCPGNNESAGKKKCSHNSTLTKLIGNGAGYGEMAAACH